MSDFELERVPADDSSLTLVALSGELDLTNVAELERRVDEVIGEGSPLVIDLNRLVFVDSASLHYFFRLGRALGRNGVAFVVEPASSIARALDIVDFGDAVTLVSTFEEARACLDGPPT